MLQITKPCEELHFCTKIKQLFFIMTSSNGNIFRVTGHLCGEFTGPRWIPHTKANDAELCCFLLICVWINIWVNNREAADLRRYRAHYDVIVMLGCNIFKLSDVYVCQETMTSLIRIMACYKPRWSLNQNKMTFVLKDWNINIIYKMAAILVRFLNCNSMAPSRLQLISYLWLKFWIYQYTSHKIQSGPVQIYRIKF